MIQFKYFHTSKGYVGRLSISKDSRDYTFYNSVFDKIRSVTDGAETFAYATISSGTSVMMQSGSNAQGVFAHGIHIDSLGEFPCQYIDRLDRDIADPESVGAQLPEEGLPSPDFAPALPQNSRLYQFIPKLIDALVFGAPQKRILIHTDDPSEAREFLGVLSAILPHDFMMRTGFCIGSKSINTTEIKIPRPGSQPDTVFIKIWIPKITNYRFETYANTNFVFDVENGRDNYTSALSTFGEAIKKAIETKGFGELKNLINSVNLAGSPTFKADGTVDTDRLNIRSSNYILRLENNPEVARKLLKSVNCSDAEERSSAAAAIAIIADNNPTADDLATMITLCAKSKELEGEDQVHDNLINTMSDYGLFGTLSAELQKKSLELIRATDLQKIGAAWYKDNSIAKTDSMCRTLYDLYFKFIADALEKGASTAGIKASALGYFGVFEGTRLSKKCTEGIIGSIFENKEFKFRDDVLAILLANIDKNGTDRVMNDRIGIVKANLQKQTAAEQFEFIVGIRNKLADLAHEIGEGNLYGVEEFPFDSTAGKGWCSAIVGGRSVKGDVKAPLSESVEELIKYYGISNSRKFRPMTSLIFSVLFDESYVKDHLKKFTDPGYERYRKMYRDYVRRINDSIPKSEPVKVVEESAYEADVQPVEAEADQGIAASAARARQMHSQAGRAPAASDREAMSGKRKSSLGDKLEKSVPTVSLDYKTTENNEKIIKNLKRIRTHLVSIEMSKRKQVFGMVAKLSKAEDAYVDFKDADKAKVRRMSGLDEQVIEDIFCRDKKSQSRFVKAVKSVDKEYAKARKNKEKAAKQQAKQAANERKAAAKKVEKSKSAKPADDRPRAARPESDRPKADRSQADKKTRR